MSADPLVLVLDEVAEVFAGSGQDPLGAGVEERVAAGGLST